jgi:hypothetical protein
VVAAAVFKLPRRERQFFSSPRVQGVESPDWRARTQSPTTVISNEAGRRFFFRVRSCERVGLRSEKSLFSFLIFSNRQLISME